MSKFIAGLLCCWIMISAFAVSAQEPITYARVCHYYDAINMRDAPGTISHIIGQVNINQNLIVLEKNVRGRGTWSRVQVEGTDQIGWVYAYYLAYEPRVNYVTEDDVNLRVYPGTNQESITQLSEGDAITVLGYENIYGNYRTWFYVRHHASGLEGWIHGVFIEGDNLGCLPLVATARDGRFSGVVWTWENPVEVYNEPYRLETKPLARLWDGERVQLLDQIVTNASVVSYIRVQSSGIEGWVEGSPRILDYGGASSGMLILPVLVRSAVDSLHVRAEPNTESVIVGELERGACINATDSRRIGEDGWLYLPEAGGWVAMNYMEPC